MKTSRDCSGIEKGDRIGRPHNYFPAIEIDVDHHFAAPPESNEVGFGSQPTLSDGRLMSRRVLFKK
jgi:hypothetical protein